MKLIRSATGTVYAITDQGWRRVTHKKPGRKVTRRQLVRAARRLAFNAANGIREERRAV